ncbi:MAG: ribosome assembly cofactor RimP [Bacteroidaceae bacterium]|nr:ribosome assembly cofactor RimP [Bacteroidaceae bacterium]
MIKKEIVTQLVEQWLEGQEYFLVDVSVSADNRIVVEIDHKEGVWIEDCVALSRFIEDHLDREAEDFELEVGSAGIGQPFKVIKQYLNHVGCEVEVLTAQGTKMTGVLKEADEEHFVVTTNQKVKVEGAKRPKLVEVDVPLRYDEVKYTKYAIRFK